MHKPTLISRGGLAITMLLAATMLTTTAHAQLLAAGLPGQRALGVRYAEINGAWIDPRAGGFDRHGGSFGLAANFPATAHLDFGASYALGSIKSGGTRLTDAVWNAALVAHGSGPGAKPFAGAALGYEWAKETFAGFKASEDQGTWALGAGCEIPAGTLTLTPSLSYGDGSRKHSVGAMHYGLQASTWFGGGLGGFAEVMFSDYTSNRGEAWTYRAGLRCKF